MTIYSNYKANPEVYIKLQENVSVSSNVHLSRNIVGFVKNTVYNDMISKNVLSADELLKQPTSSSIMDFIHLLLCSGLAFQV